MSYTSSDELRAKQRQHEQIEHLERKECAQEIEFTLASEKWPMRPSLCACVSVRVCVYASAQIVRRHHSLISLHWRLQHSVANIRQSRYYSTIVLIFDNILLSLHVAVIITIITIITSITIRTIIALVLSS